MASTDKPNETYPAPWPPLGHWLVPLFWGTVLLVVALYFALGSARQRPEALSMLRAVLFGLGVLTLTVAAVARGAPQVGHTFKTCSQAYRSCLARSHLATECALERKWCLLTGTFVSPRTRSVHKRLQRK